jgi:hypothetical protein
MSTDQTQDADVLTSRDIGLIIFRAFHSQDRHDIGGRLTAIVTSLAEIPSPASDEMNLKICALGDLLRLILVQSEDDDQSPNTAAIALLAMSLGGFYQDRGPRRGAQPSRPPHRQSPRARRRLGQIRAAAAAAGTELMTGPLNPVADPPLPAPKRPKGQTIMTFEEITAAIAADDRTAIEEAFKALVDYPRYDGPIPGATPARLMEALDSVCGALVGNDRIVPDGTLEAVRGAIPDETALQGGCYDHAARAVRQSAPRFRALFTQACRRRA